MIGNVLKSLGGAKMADRATVYRDLMNTHQWEQSEDLPASLPVKGDRSTYMRVSALGYLCPRLESIKIAEKFAITGSLDPESAYTFMLGHHHHSMMQDSLVPTILQDRMRGWWKFGKATASSWASVGMPDLLPKPDKRRWKYEELYAFDDNFFVHGHPDMVLDWTGSGVPGTPDACEVQEYKTKDPTIWAAIDPDQGGYPDPVHVIQTQAYMWLLGLDHGRIVYIKKGERRIQEAFVEWPLRRDPDVVNGIQSLLATYWDSVTAAHAGRTWYEHRLPKCSEFSKGRAAGCPARYECHGKGWKKERTDIRRLTPEELAAK